MLLSLSFLPPVTLRSYVVSSLKSVAWHDKRGSMHRAREKDAVRMLPLLVLKNILQNSYAHAGGSHYSQTKSASG